VHTAPLFVQTVSPVGTTGPESRSGTLAPASGSLQQGPAAQLTQHNPQAGSGGGQQGKAVAQPVQMRGAASQARG
jgi:hypothetical protein